MISTVLLAILIYFLYYYYFRSNNKVEELDKVDELQEAMKVIINKGCDISFGNSRLYFSHRNNEYIILRYDRNANLKMDEEESFVDINCAINRFIEHSNGKLL